MRHTPQAQSTPGPFRELHLMHRPAGQPLPLSPASHEEDILLPKIQVLCEPQVSKLNLFPMPCLSDVFP